MNRDGDKIISVMGSVILHLLVILLLTVAFLRANVPEEIAVIEVDFGGGSPASSSAQGSGNILPQPAITPPPTVSSRPQPQAQPPVISQDDEETIRIAEERKRKAAEERRRQAEITEQRRKEEEAERARKAEQAQANAINNQVAGSFGKGTGTGASQGNTGAAGSGGGNNPFGNGRGSGGTNDGSGSWELAGRGMIGDMTRPAFSVPEDGRIEIEITVDPQGKVINARIGGGTKGVISEVLRNSALATARTYAFTPTSNPNNQVGKIIYNYSLRP